MYLALCEKYTDALEMFIRVLLRDASQSTVSSNEIPLLQLLAESIVTQKMFTSVLA